MSYADTAPMMEDEVLLGRVQACVTEQAALRVDADDPLAEYAMAQPKVVAAQFMVFFGADQTLVSAYTADPSNGGEASVTDQAILSKVQAVWVDVLAVLNLS